MIVMDEPGWSFHPDYSEPANPRPVEDLQT
jgi:hypothetical protein